MRRPLIPATLTPRQIRKIARILAEPFDLAYILAMPTASVAANTKPNGWVNWNRVRRGRQGPAPMQGKVSRRPSMQGPCHGR
jgi:hypothetical protein